MSICMWYYFTEDRPIIPDEDDDDLDEEYSPEKEEDET